VCAFVRCKKYLSPITSSFRTAFAGVAPASSFEPKMDPKPQKVEPRHFAERAAAKMILSAPGGPPPPIRRQAGIATKPSIPSNSLPVRRRAPAQIIMSSAHVGAAAALWRQNCSPANEPASERSIECTHTRMEKGCGGGSGGESEFWPPAFYVPIIECALSLTLYERRRK